MDEFETSDMYLAAALLSYGAEIAEIDKTNRNRQRITFRGEISKILVYTDNGFYLVIEKPIFAEVKSKYGNNKLFFPPSYPDAVRKIKSAIHS